MLAVGLGIGVTTVEEAVAWADATIAAGGPHWSICEVALMGDRYPPDVIRALRQVPGDVDESWVLHEVIGALPRVLADDRSRADAVASALYDLAMQDRLPNEELQNLGWWASDALDLADRRIVEATRDDVIDEIIVALRRAVDQR